MLKEKWGVHGKSTIFIIISAIYRAKIFFIMPKWNKQKYIRKNSLNMYYKYLYTSTKSMVADKELRLTAWLKIYIDYKIFKRRLGKMEK